MEGRKKSRNICIYLYIHSIWLICLHVCSFGDTWRYAVYKHDMYVLNILDMDC